MPAASSSAFDPERYLGETIRIMPYWPRERYLELAPAYLALTRARLDARELETELGPITAVATGLVERQFHQITGAPGAGTSTSTSGWR